MSTFKPHNSPPPRILEWINIGIQYINNTHTTSLPITNWKNNMHSNFWSHPSMCSKAKQVSSIAITIITYVPQQNEYYTANRRGKNQLIVADTSRHYVCSFIGWWFGAMEFDFKGLLMAADMSFVESNHSHHHHHHRKEWLLIAPIGHHCIL